MSTPSPTTQPAARLHRRPLAALTALLLSVGALSGGVADAAPATGAPVRVVIELVAPPSTQVLSDAERLTLRQRAVRAQRGAVGAADATTAQREDAALATLTTARSQARSAQQRLTAAAARSGVTLTRAHGVVDVLDAVFAEVPSTSLATLRALPGVRQVSLDGAVTAFVEPGPAAAGGGTADDSAPSVPADGAAADRGRGTVIAVVDTGVDYGLPDLGSGFGAGRKVVAGYDFVHDDADPMDDHYHGTHVAGTAAGTGAGSVTGVAPGATLTAWKVLDDRGQGYQSDVVRGIEAAVDPASAHPADVVNLSLGGDGDGRDPVTRAAAAAAASGVVVVAAAGNAGPGARTIGVPAVSPSVLAVGASVTDLRLATSRVVGADRDLPTWRVAWSASAPAAPVVARVVDVGAGTPADYRRVGSVTGAIVSYVGAAPRSSDDYPGDSFAQARLAERLGAVAALVRQPSELDPAAAAVAAEPGVLAAVADRATAGSLGSGSDTRLDRLVLLGVHGSDYAPIAADVAAGGVRVRLSPVDATDQVASFSSRGPTADLTLKPDLVAPGVEIRSTVPRSLGIPGNAYRLSGTSMAAPAVAGAAAVLRAQAPDLPEDRVRARLTGSAATLAGASAALPATVQGAGRLDLAAALRTPVTAAPPVVSFGLAPGRGGTAVNRTVRLTNPTGRPVTAQLSVRRADGSVGEASVSPASVRLPRGGTADVVVRATSTVGRTDTDLSGQVVAALSDGTSLHVPFLQSTRTLFVKGTPEVTTGATEVMVTSVIALDGPPQVSLRNTATGDRRTVVVRPAQDMPGWYRGDVALPTVGTWTVDATAHRGAATVPGQASIERVSGLRAGSWQRLGRAASAGELAVSTARAGVAVQAVSGSLRPFVTTDHGTTWTQVRSLPVADGAGTPVMDPDEPNAFWYAVDGVAGQPPLDPTFRAKVLRTTDLGRTWEVLPFPDVQLRGFTGAGETLVAAVDAGLQVSRDGGRHWQLVAFAWPQTPTGVTVVGDDVLVSGYSTVWRVRAVSSDRPSAPQPVVRGAGGFTSVGAGDRVAAAVELNGTVRISSDGGTTWRTSTLPDGDFAVGARVLGTEVFVGSNRGYWRTRDAGVTWTLTEYAVFGPVGIDVERWPDRPRSLLMPLENAGLYASADDGRTERRIGVSGTTVAQVATTSDPEGRPVVVLADDQGTDSLVMPAAGPVEETAWGPTGGEGIVGASVRDLAVDPRRSGAWTRIRTTASGLDQIQQSTDAGATWTTVGPQPFGVTFQGLALDPRGARRAAVGYRTTVESGLVVTRDGWRTWQVLTHDDLTVRDVAVDPTTPGRLWIAAEQGLFRSDDDGQTLVEVQDAPFATVFVDPQQPQRVLAGGATIRVSDDGGRTFRQAAGPTGDVLIGSFAAVRTTVPGSSVPQQVLFAGSAALRPYGWVVAGRGVYRSTDGGATWTSVSDGLQDTSVTSMAVTPDGAWLVLGTRQGGVHRAQVADLVR